tara:strand:+ start:76 stop:222 length:147 start_codon:yes stop_codon:yes gene_type:complete
MGYKIDKNGMGPVDWIIVFIFISGFLYECSGGFDDDDTICEYSYSRSC